MIGHNIEHLSKPRRRQRIAHVGMCLGATKFFIHASWIGYVVSMRAARGRLKIWRTVKMTDAKIVKVWRYSTGRGKTKLTGHLNAVGGNGIITISH